MLELRAVQIASEVTGVPAELITGRSTNYKAVNARYIAWLMLKDKDGLGWSDIARMFGYDHSTVIHGVGKIRAEIPNYADTRELVERVTQQYTAPGTKVSGS